MSKVDQLRLGARVCFVLALMTGDKSYLNNELRVNVVANDLIDASKEFYGSITGFSEERVRGDVELFSSKGTYAALYLVGSHLIRDMENRGRSRLGESFNRIEFLESLLQEGMVPLSYAKRALEHKGVI